MRKREREEKITTTQKVHRTNNGGSEVKEKAFSGHTQEGGVFGTSRRAGRRCRGLVGVACRAWLGVGLVVVVAMSLSLFTEHAG